MSDNNQTFNWHDLNKILKALSLVQFEIDSI